MNSKTIRNIMPSNSVKTPIDDSPPTFVNTQFELGILVVCSKRSILLVLVGGCVNVIAPPIV